MRVDGQRLLESRPAHNLRYLLTAVAILLAAAVLRIQGLAPMSAMLHHDEAWNGWRAAQMLSEPHFVLFFPDNTGNEAAWTYILTPFVGLFGAQPFSLRLAAIFTGILSVAAMIPLARTLLRPGAVLWAAVVLAVLYWPVHLSHIAFHANLVPFFGMLALTAVLRAFQRPGIARRWVLAGLFTGLLAYSYTAGHAWTLTLLLIALIWAMFHRRFWRSVGMMIGLALLLALPVYMALLSSPAEDGGLDRTLVSDASVIMQNTSDWLGAWLYAGDSNPTHNLPLRPVLDLPLAVLAGLGLLSLWGALRRKWTLALLILLGIVSLLPSLLTLEAPHFLRAIGATVPLALLIGAGAWGLMMLIRRITPTVIALVLPLLLIGWSFANTASDFQTWLATEEFGIYIDERVYEAMQIIDSVSATDTPIVIPEVDFHPVASFLAADMPERELFYVSYPELDPTCFSIPREMAVYLDLPIVLPHFEDRILGGHVVQLYAQANNEFNLYRIAPDPLLADDWSEQAVAGDFLALRLLPPLPDTVSPGDTLTLRLGMRPLAPIPQQYQAFVHLYGEITPYDGGQNYANADNALCPYLFDPAAPVGWNYIQQISLTLPPDIPSGTYTITLGLYDLQNPDERPPLQTPSGETRFYAAHTLTIR